MGSVAGGDPYPDDLDLAIIISNTGEIATIAKYARQMSRHYHGWEVFLFDCDLSWIGRICHRRECPGQSVECYVSGCGKPPHVKVNPEFEYDEKIFLTRPSMFSIHLLKRVVYLHERMSWASLNHGATRYWRISG